ncbi:MAG: hypothetical protein KJ621_12120 [Proteobacteria bacterium]|nr:hypothetical protein [Pseudomonadota bacterium]MBU1741999.1 hypothetical protein [Pseudomonadota bacterium]
MAEQKQIPESFPPMGAEFEKPYMEFEYKGELFRVENLKGGHNSKVAKACKSNPPKWDEEKKRWVVPIENNLIDIDFAAQPEVTKDFPPDSPLKAIHIISNPRSKYQSTGLLISSTDDPSGPPLFPVDCIFDMFIRVNVKGKWSLINVRPFRLRANGLNEWPPPVGTVYVNEDYVELFPEWIPLASKFMKPIVRILPSDKTVLTDVFENPNV